MPSAFITTLADLRQIPTLIQNDWLHGYAMPRIALVGRSNVGKSSLLNALLKQTHARVSAEPGKTKAIHFFLWKEYSRIVADLPGYGFAKRARGEQNAWATLIEGYFKADPLLLAVLLLWDSRVGPTDSDIEALRFLLDQNVRIQIVMTKSDQLKTQSERAKRKNEIQKIMKEWKEELILTPIWVSVRETASLDDLRKRVIHETEKK